MNTFNNIPEIRYQSELKKRQKLNSLRVLKDSFAFSADHTYWANFSSNDYLGLSFDKTYQGHMNGFFDSKRSSLRCQTVNASRLVDGNSPLHGELERELKQFFGAESALFTVNGYLANIGLLSACAGKGGVILYDQFCHASLKDGIRLSQATSFAFRHNDLNHLESRLSKIRKETNHPTEIFIVVESLYSMDGDYADLPALVSLCELYGARLIVDEAHTSAVHGPLGQGFVYELDLQDKVFARIMTFGKGFAQTGACILGSSMLHQYLVNFCRPLIYSTAPHMDQIIRVLGALSFFRFHSAFLQDRREILFRISETFNDVFSLTQPSYIKSLQFDSEIAGNRESMDRFVEKCEQTGIKVVAMKSPTVPKKLERIRIGLSSAHRRADLERLAAIYFDLIRGEVRH